MKIRVNYIMKKVITIKYDNCIIYKNVLLSIKKIFSICVPSNNINIYYSHIFDMFLKIHNYKHNIILYLIIKLNIFKIVNKNKLVLNKEYISCETMKQ